MLFSFDSSNKKYPDVEYNEPNQFHKAKSLCDNLEFLIFVKYLHCELKTDICDTITILQVLIMAKYFFF